MVLVWVILLIGLVESSDWDRVRTFVCDPTNSDVTFDSGSLCPTTCGECVSSLSNTWCQDAQITILSVSASLSGYTKFDFVSLNKSIVSSSCWAGNPFGSSTSSQKMVVNLLQSSSLPPSTSAPSPPTAPVTGEIEFSLSCKNQILQIPQYGQCTLPGIYILGISGGILFIILVVSIVCFCCCCFCCCCKCCAKKVEKSQEIEIIESEEAIRQKAIYSTFANADSSLSHHFLNPKPLHNDQMIVLDDMSGSHQQQQQQQASSYQPPLVPNAAAAATASQSTSQYDQQQDYESTSVDYDGSINDDINNNNNNNNINVNMNVNVYDPNINSNPNTRSMHPRPDTMTIDLSTLDDYFQ
eukprot:TRINITY_DN242_c0_g1_i1.p1 TRINITY_DN242_c0_g1~~TRINITY_DN242_c0_g1_i1.p1  ORF type:complete len:355 (+),score=91.00 TRINITY_DN242_c0_g1_i1:23-1087(+)